MFTSSVSMGAVDFEITNGGAVPHNVRLVKSDAPLSDLEFVSGAVDERQLDVVVRSANIDPREDVTVRATLTPGNYIIFCNLPGHFQLGMYRELTVK